MIKTVVDTWHRSLGRPAGDAGGSAGERRRLVRAAWSSVIRPFRPSTPYTGRWARCSHRCSRGHTRMGGKEHAVRDPAAQHS